MITKSLLVVVTVLLCASPAFTQFGQSNRLTDLASRLSRELGAAMRQIPGVADIENSLEKSKPELRVNGDRQRASDLGIPVATIAATMSSSLPSRRMSSSAAAGRRRSIRKRSWRRVR